MFEDLKARQSETWGSAPYEPIVGLMADIHNALIELLGPRLGEDWLDLATGTGAVARRAARAGANVTGIDLAPSLVETARQLAVAECLPIRFDVGDCERLPYADARFHVLSSSMGIVYAPDHRAAASELGRVCRPDGRLGLACWKADDGFNSLLDKFRPPLPEGVGVPSDWGDSRYAQELLGEDFELEFTESHSALCGRSGEDLWRLFTNSVGTLKALAGSLSPEKRDEFNRAGVAWFERHRAGEGIVAPRSYLLIRGRRKNGSPHPDG